MKLKNMELWKNPKGLAWKDLVPISATSLIDLTRKRCSGRIQLRLTLLEFFFEYIEYYFSYIRWTANRTEEGIVLEAYNADPGRRSL